MSQPYYQPQQPYQNYGQMNYGPYGPPPPQKSGPNWLLIILGIVGGGGVLLALVCCGGIVYLASPPQASPQAKLPFEITTVPVPALPARGGNRQTIEPGVTREELDRQRALRLRQLVTDLLGFGCRHLLELGLGGWIGDDPVEHHELGTEPAHLARRGRDWLDCGIIF